MNEWKISGTLGRTRQLGQGLSVTIETEMRGRTTYIEVSSFPENGLDFSRYQQGQPMLFCGRVQMRKIQSVKRDGGAFDLWIPSLIVEAVELPLEDGIPAPKGSEYEDPFAEPKEDEDEIPFDDGPSLR